MSKTFFLTPLDSKETSSISFFNLVEISYMMCSLSKFKQDKFSKIFWSEYDNFIE